MSLNIVAGGRNVNRETACQCDCIAAHRLYNLVRFGYITEGNNMLGLKLEKPLAIFDIEATGLNAKADRIVEICIVKILPDDTREVHTMRVNPEMPIPAEATRIHGIKDSDVASCQTFDQIARKISDILENCDLGGYNAINFDIPLLIEEFMRARIIFNMDGRRVVDAQRIFHKKEPRDLTAAVSFFCNDKLEGAHGAESDTLATVRVLEAQMQKYADLPRTVEGMDEFCNPRDPDWADRTGRLKWVDADIAINFGQKKGSRLKQLAATDSSYLKWILRGDFPRDTQDIVRQVLETGQLPKRQAKPAESK